MKYQTDSKVYLFLMLGFPGSGKSYVSDWLAPHMRAVHLRSDDMRLWMFAGAHPKLHTGMYQRQVHGAMQYAVGQALRAGYSVIYDSNHNAYEQRKDMEKAARAAGAVPVVVWVQAPLEVAKQRVLARTAAGGHQIFGTDFIERMARRLEPPAKHELAITLDGATEASSQQQAFDKQLSKL